MNSHNEVAARYVDTDALELGFVASLTTFCEVLRSLRINGRRWWVDCDDSVAERGFITLSVGYPGCEDQLNVTSFRLPLVREGVSDIGATRIVVLVERSNFVADQPRPGRGCDRGLTRELLEEFNAAFIPLRQALARRLLNEE